MNKKSVIQLQATFLMQFTFYKFLKMYCLLKNIVFRTKKWSLDRGATSRRSWIFFSNFLGAPSPCNDAVQSEVQSSLCKSVSTRVLQRITLRWTWLQELEWLVYQQFLIFSSYYPPPFLKQAERSMPPKKRKLINEDHQQNDDLPLRQQVPTVNASEPGPSQSGTLQLKRII